MTTQFTLRSDAWSEHARKYNSAKNGGESLSAPLLQSAFDRHFFTILDELIASKEGKRPIKILCLCGGTGAEMTIICQKYSKQQIQVINTDNAKGMVEVSQETIDRAGFQDRAKAQLMDAMQIDLPDESFDVVTLILGPMLLPDAQACFKEIARVLVPQGVFLTLTPGPMELHDVLFTCKKQIMEEVMPSGSDMKNVYVEQLLNKWGKPEALVEQIQQDKTLFTQIQANQNPARFPASNEEELEQLLESMWSNPGMSQLYLNAFDEEQIAQYKRAVYNEFKKRQESAKPNPYSLSMHSCSASAVKAALA